MLRYFDPDKWRSKRPAVAVGIPMTATLHRTAVNQFLSLMLRLREDDVFLPCIESAIASEARNTIINEFLNLPESVEYLFLFDADTDHGRFCRLDRLPISKSQSCQKNIGLMQNILIY